jgi:hypothetical protein
MLSTRVCHGRNKVWRAQTDKSVEENGIGCNVVLGTPKTAAVKTRQLLLLVLEGVAGSKVNLHTTLELSE